MQKKYLLLTFNYTLWVANCCWLVFKFLDDRNHFFLSSASGSEYGNNICPVHIFEKKKKKQNTDVIKALESLFSLVLYKLKCAYSKINLQWCCHRNSQFIFSAWPIGMWSEIYESRAQSTWSGLRFI